MAGRRLIDVHHLGVARAIGAYLLETRDGPAIVDCGPTTSLPGLEAGLDESGLSLADVRHLLLTHIHLDHAGGAGTIVREHPHVQVHVSEIGAPHLVDPTRLGTSARRLYGEDFDRLWGELAPVPAANVHVVGDDVLGLTCVPAPGHAYHQVAYLDGEGTLYPGDACGVRIVPERLVLPPVPPPELDVEAWDATLDELERRAPERLALTHFGVVDDVTEHVAQLRRRLHAWEAIVEGGASEEEFAAAVAADTAAERGGADDAYRSATPPGAYAGLKRWVEKVKPSRSRASASG